MLREIIYTTGVATSSRSNRVKMAQVVNGEPKQQPIHHRTTRISNHDEKPFKVLLSVKFVMLSVATAAAFAFGIGQICRVLLMQQIKVRAGPLLHRRHQHHQNDHHLYDDHHPQHHLPDIAHTSLPQPMLPAGKRMPNTLYTSKQLNTGIPTTSDSVLLARPPHLLAGFDADQPEKIVRSVEISRTGDPVIDNISYSPNEAPSSTTTMTPHPTPSSVDAAEEEEEEEIHEPAGQHLLIDIENVDGDFLNSEGRLANAMLEMVNESGLTMLSYHCHSLEPMGVSCVAVLLESHVSFHTWPVPGVITLDVFTCGPNPLRPLVKYAEKLFGVPQQPLPGHEEDSCVRPPRMNWIMKNRGFPKNDAATAENPESVEIRQYMVGWMEYDLKEEVATVETDFQTIEVFDVLNPRFRTRESYERSLSGDGSYEAQNPELYMPDRIVYLDGIMQSRRYGDSAYHESLVHPAMFAHDDPKRVAIIGGGEGATLREILKHNTVTKATMVEIDGDMVNASRTYLPEWSDCSRIQGSAPSCFDDPRAELIITDAISWFISHFGKDVEYKDEDLYDVIIMDALDPSSVVEFSDVLYNNDDLMAAISNSLTEEGILIAQVGQSDFMNDPPKQYSRERVLNDAFIPQLQKYGFEKVKEFEDFHGGFMGVWGYLVAFKDITSSENWYTNQANIDLEIYDRIIPTITGESSLRYFDGAAMQSLAYPSRATEEVFCRDGEHSFCENGGHGYDPYRLNAPISTFEVRTSGVSGAGRGIFFKEDVPKGSYVAIDEAVHSMLVNPGTRSLIKDMDRVCVRWEILDSYLFGYGFATDFFGPPAYLVDPGIMTFINHGCNSTNNINEVYSVTEMTADPHEIPPDLMASPLESYVYNPYVDRNYHHLFYYAYVNQDVSTGSELLDNYLAYLHGDNWEWGILNYRAMCMKTSPGAVTAYEDYDDRGVEY